MLKKIIAEQKSAVFQEYQIQNQCIDPENFSDHKPSILSFHFYYNIQTNASKSMKKQTNKKTNWKKNWKKNIHKHTHIQTLKKCMMMSYEKNKTKNNFLKNHSIIIINNGSKKR